MEAQVPIWNCHFRLGSNEMRVCRWHRHWFRTSLSPHIFASLPAFQPSCSLSKANALTGGPDTHQAPTALGSAPWSCLWPPTPALPHGLAGPSSAARLLERTWALSRCRQPQAPPYQSLKMFFLPVHAQQQVTWTSLAMITVRQCELTWQPQPVNAFRVTAGAWQECLAGRWGHSSLVCPYWHLSSAKRGKKKW